MKMIRIRRAAAFFATAIRVFAVVLAIVGGSLLFEIEGLLMQLLVREQVTHLA